MSQTPLDRRLEELEQRLGRLEAHLGIGQTLPLQVPPPPPTPPLQAPPLATPLQTLPLPTPPPEIPPPLPAPEPGQVPELHEYPRAQPAMPLILFKPVLPYASAPSASASRQSKANIEQAIGLKWAGWIGAVVLVIGAGLGIKFAYDQGWFGGLPPELRLTLMSLVGFALIGLGEWVYRRVNVISAAGLFGAGVAVLFLVSYAGHQYYGLYERNTAFVLMGVATLIGAAVAVRGNLVSIAVLSLIGGNLAPMVLNGDPTHIIGFLAYILMLQVVALFLAAWGRGGKWWTLRVFALVTTALWMAATLGQLNNHRNELFIFTLIYAGLFQVELILAAARGRLGAGEKGVETGGPTVFSMVVTAGAVAGILYLMRDASHVMRGAWVIGFSAFCAAVGFTLTRGRPTLRPLGIGYRLQAAALLIVAVPVVLTEQWIVFGWGALALAFAAAGRVLRIRVARFTAVVTWTLAVLHLFYRQQDAEDVSARAIWFTLHGHAVMAWVVLAGVLALVGHGVAWLVEPPIQEEAPQAGDDKLSPQIAAVGGTLVWLWAMLLGLPGIPATLGIILFAWLLTGVDFLAPRRRLVVHLAGLLLLAMLKWAFVDLLTNRLSPEWSATRYQPFWNPAMEVGAFLCFSLLAICHLRRNSLLEILQDWTGSETSIRELALSVAATVILLMTLGLSFEIDRVIERGLETLWGRPHLKQFCWTMLWSVSGILLMVLGHQVQPTPERRWKWVRLAGVLPMLMAIKWLIFDTLAWRALDGVVPVSVRLNMQILTGLVVMGSLMTLALLGGPRTFGKSWLIPLANFLAVLVVLWGASLEIDRFFEKMGLRTAMISDPRLAKEMALSVFWSVFAILCIVAGFRFRAVLLRFFGLGLFALTLVKVVLVDLESVGHGYRILSFMGLGLLLLGTSVVYGKLSPRLLRMEAVEQGK